MLIQCLPGAQLVGELESRWAVEVEFHVASVAPIGFQAELQRGGR